MGTPVRHQNLIVATDHATTGPSVRRGDGTMDGASIRRDAVDIPRRAAGPARSMLLITPLVRGIERGPPTLPSRCVFLIPRLRRRKQIGISCPAAQA